MKEEEDKCKQELVALKKEFEEFVYIVSHDIKSPMRAISNITTWIEEDLGAVENQEVIANLSLLKNRVNRMENMMNGLLELSRVDRFELEFYEVNISKMIANSIALFDTNSTIEFTLNSTLVNENCVTLGAKLQKVLMNLLDNAVRFHDKENRKVGVEVLETETDYEIKVSDNGPGIPEQAVSKIFSIFYTVNSKDVVDTTGAGLAISCKIMKLVGGKIKYTAGINNGSIFTLIWPKIIILKN
ncbi:sensor histidine kinase [Flavobacterium sandaracinum]|uniref:histidine kinase n=1 Tax=Flavobacterium sandaracinum TaxID=2541733 RepID=A0A4R5D3D5_9FLAO|nr:HAMP domain-containing sensor histidine kinase [Flavobacterium sandaracinum]TDE06907.1 HAMP domain-containing histidine kinase [Flavobacterium sandaracinum]